MSWNDYPSHVSKSFINRFTKKINDPPVHKDDDNEKSKIELYIKVPYLGDRSKRLLNDLVKKLRRYLKPNVKIVTKNNTKKISMFCPSKDPVPKSQKSDPIYKIVCPGCQETYVGKTDRCFIIRLNEHGRRDDQPMYRHLISCEKFHEFVSFFNLPLTFGHDEVDRDSFILNSVVNNATILESSRNWSQLEIFRSLLYQEIIT